MAEPGAKFHVRYPDASGKFVWSQGYESFEEARKEAAGLELNARAVAIGFTIEEYKNKANANRTLVKTAIESFLTEAAKTKKENSLAAYKQHLAQCQVSRSTGSESRDVKIPTDLVEMLRQWKKQAPHSRWIFVNEEGRPDNHFLRKFKRIALRAGLNCGNCTAPWAGGRYHMKPTDEVTCKTHPVCEHLTYTVSAKPAPAIGKRNKFPSARFSSCSGTSR
jgi:hypothetical protein